MNHIDMAFRFKSAPTNGGFIANITMRDCAVADTQQAWVLTTSYSDPNSASTTEFAEIGKFYNFASYNVSVYGDSIIPYRYLQMLIRSAIRRSHGIHTATYTSRILPLVMSEQMAALRIRTAGNH